MPNCCKEYGFCRKGIAAQEDPRLLNYFIGISGNEKYLGFGPGNQKTFGKFPAVHLGHDDVTDDQVDGIEIVAHGQGFRSAACTMD